MNNTGTWNSDLALIFLVMFFSPLVLFFFAGFLLRIMQMFEKSYTINVYEQAKPTTPKKTIIEHRSVPAKPAKPAKTKKPSKPKSCKPKTSVKKYLKPQYHNNWNDDVVADAIGGLKGLGYRMADARRIASKIYAKNQTMTADDIVIAAMEKRF